jgi:hypothetical protein
VRVDRSLLYNNAVNAAGIFGGGVANEGTTIMENSTVSNNSAVTDGGGIFNGIGSDTELFNVTITQNTADSDSDGMGEGGGVYDGCPSGFLCVVLPYTLTLQNSIISGNFDTPNNGGPGPIHPDCHGPLKSLAYNLIHTVAGCTINGDTTGNILGQPADLAPLAENGGWTPTHALLPASPAIDAGNPLVPGSSRPACAKTDQRGYPRGGAAGRCDIGAFERVFLLSLPLIRR